MIRFRFIAALLVVIVAWVMCGCSDPRNAREVGEIHRLSLDGAHTVYVVKLDDGTRCAAYGDGGITCDWHKGVE